MKKLSVVIPVYNVEKYLRQCIDSILAQTMTDYEIILVDDGSSDNSGNICDEYDKRYENIHTFHKENGGLSDARNYGIRMSEGDYIIFVDSDDFYDDPELFFKIENLIYRYSPTVIGFSVKLFFEYKGIPNAPKKVYNEEYLNSDINYEEKLKYLISNDSLRISAYSNIIRRSYLIEKDLFFKKGIVSEDIEWSMRLFSDDLKIVFLNSSAYITRRDREGSITNTIKEKNLRDLYTIISEYSEKFIHSESVYEKLLLHYLAYQYCILCGLLVKVKYNKRQLIKDIKKYAWILDYDLSPKVKRIKKLKNMIGITFTIKILGFYIKHRSR